MTEYCTVKFSWESDKDPQKVTEYRVGSDYSEEHEHGRLHSRDHFFFLGQLAADRLQVTYYPTEISLSGSQSGSMEGEEPAPPCTLSLECKPVYSMLIKGFAIASEARTVEVFDGRDGSYLQTVRGARDVEDSEADNSKIHFMCRCTLDQPLKSINVKFLSLGPRQSFEIAHIRLMMEQSSNHVDGQRGPGQGINMEKLRQDVDSMGDTVSERARAFLTTLENFQKSKRGAVDDMRHLLLDQNTAWSDSQTLGNMTALLAMFSGSMGMSSGHQTPPFPLSPTALPQVEGSVMNQMLSQMMSSLAVGEGRGADQGGDRGNMYKFLQTVCTQVSEQRAEADTQVTEGIVDGEEGEKQNRQEAISEELESKLESKLDTLVESRLEAVEERLMTRVDAHLAELETRMSTKLDAVLALLQNAASPAK